MIGTSKNKVGIKILLLCIFPLVYACKGSKTETESNFEDPVTTSEENIENLEERIAKRKAQFEEDSLLMAQKEATIDNFLKSERNSSDDRGFMIVEKKAWVDSIQNYIADKKAFEEKYPIVELEDFRKNNLFYRYFYGDPFALEKMIAIIENGNNDSINKLYKNLNEYKSGFEEERLFSNKKLSSLVIESLNNEELERNAIAVVIKLKNGTEILENRLESGLTKYPQAILSRLSFKGESEIGLKYLEKGIKDTSQIKLSDSQIEKSLKYYIKFARNENIRQAAVQLAIDYYLDKVWYSENDFHRISARRYKNPATLEAYILHHGDKQIFPFLLKLQNQEKNTIVDYKLWEAGYELPENKIAQLLKNKELMVLMLENDSERQLLKVVDNFYEKVFQGILSSNKMSTISFWNHNLHNVVYYFKNEEKDVFRNRIQEVLEAEKKPAIEEREALSKIMELYEMANESKIDILDYLKSIGFITSNQYKLVAKQLTSKNNDSKGFDDNYFEVSDSLNKYIAFFVNDYKYVLKSIKDHKNELFNDFSFVAKTREVKGEYGFMEKEPTAIITIYNEKVYIMFPEKYSPDPYCMERNFQDRFIHFINTILEDNNVKNRIIPYSISIGCELFRCYIGTKEQVKQIAEKYYFITF